MAEPHYSIKGFLVFLLSTLVKGKPGQDGFLKFLLSKLEKGEPGQDEPGQDEPGQHKPGQHKPPKFQDFHLVVAALIAAVTFQACVNPPGGVWQDDKSSEELAGGAKREAGRAVYSADETAFYVFLAFDTLAFSTSMYLLIYLTIGYPFFFEVVVAMASMGITYGASIFAITPTGFKGGHWLLSIAAVPIIVRAAILIYKYVGWEKNKARTLLSKK